MATDGDPKISLMFLYKNDSFYSLCLADLMTVPQQVKNKIIKEQKEFAKMVKKLEQQKRSRLRELEEEKRQFCLRMIKKLAPGVTFRRGSPMATERDSRRTLFSIQPSPLHSSKSSWRNLDPRLSARPDTTFFTTAGRMLPASCTPKLAQTPSSYSPDILPTNRYNSLQGKNLQSRTKNQPTAPGSHKAAQKGMNI
ncbi:uncharacterized protein PHA67_005492 isoform 2-T2 [Liasis olivaceus]